MKKRTIALILVLAMVLPVSAFAADNSYKSWSQSDGRWGSISLAPNGSKAHTMSKEGCLVTAIAKILISAGQQDPSVFTPGKCCEALKACGMLSNAGMIQSGNYNKEFLPTYAPQLKHESSPSHAAWSQEEAVEKISAFLADNYYVIVCVKKANGRTHWMAVEEVKNGDIYVMNNGGIIPLYGTPEYSLGITDQSKFKYTGTKADQAGTWGQNTLKDIIKALANKVKPSAAASVQTHSTLRSGSRGGEVKTLQTMLNAVSGAGLAVDGGFGSKTLAAVKSFQRSRGLAVDGVVGAKTWAALEAEYNKPTPTPAPVQPDPAPAAPDPAPAPDQSDKIDFMPSVLALVPVTQPTQGMPQGQPFYFKGSITSNYPIVFARVAILTADRVDAIQSKNIEPNSTLVDIATSGLDSLKFGKLQPGSYVLYLTATDSSGAVKEWSADFSIAANHATIRKGSKGDEVRLLQTMLNQIMGAGLDVDGGFGAKTLAAVKSYQSSRGLDVDGVVGPKTWAALESEYRR